ncbi:MAG: hypothetical protein RL745_853, partial [Actinomycetota bacterium]
MSAAALPSRGALAKAGVLETDAALAMLAELPTDLVEHVAAQLPECADPDAALNGFIQVWSAHRSIVIALGEQQLRALLVLLGASPVVSEHLQRHGEDLR